MVKYYQKQKIMDDALVLIADIEA